MPSKDLSMLSNEVLDTAFIPSVPDETLPITSTRNRFARSTRQMLASSHIEDLEPRIVQSADSVMGPQEDPVSLAANIEGKQQEIDLAQQTLDQLQQQVHTEDASDLQLQNDIQTWTQSLYDLQQEKNILQARYNSTNQQIADLEAHPISSFSANWISPSAAIATVPSSVNKESMAVTMSQDGRYIARGDRTGTDLIDATSGSLLFRNNQLGYVCDVAFDPSGNRLASVYSSGTLTVIDTQTRAVKQLSMPNNRFFGNMQWMGDEIYISQQEVGTILILNVNTGARRSIQSIGTTNGIGMVGNDAIFAAGPQGPVTLYSTQGTLLAQAPSPGFALSAATSRNGSMMAVTTLEGNVVVYDRSLHVLGQATGAGRENRLAFLPGNKGLAVYDYSGRFLVFDLTQMHDGTLPTPTTLSTNPHQGYSTTMGVAPDGSMVFNIDPNKGILATRMPSTVVASSTTQAVADLRATLTTLNQDIQTKTQQIENAQQSLHNSTAAKNTLQTNHQKTLADIEAAQQTLQTLTHEKEQMEARLEALQQDLDALDNVFIENVLQYNAERVTALDTDSVYTLSEELSRIFYTLPLWQNNLETRLTMLQNILTTADAADATMLQERIDDLTARLQDIDQYLLDIRTAWIAAGGLIDANGNLDTLNTENTVLYTEELQQTLTTLSLGLSALQDDITALLAEHTVTSLLSPVGAVHTDGGIQRLSLSLSLPGGEAVLSAFPAPGQIASLTTNGSTLHIDHGIGVLDFSESLTRITSISGNVQGALPNEAISITAYRGNTDIGSVTPDADGNFSFTNPEGITSMIIRGTSNALTVSNLSASGDWSSPQYETNAPSPAFNATLSRMTAPVLPFGNIDAYKNIISLTYMRSGTLRGQWNSNAGLWASINPNMYSAIRLMGSDPHFMGLNYVSNDGQVHSYPQDRYEVIGNIVLIYPSGIANQRDVYLKVSGVSTFINNQDTQRDTLLPPLSTPPSVGLAGRGSLGDASAGWGSPITEWSSSADQTESFQGFFNVQNPSLTPFVLTSVSVHVGPRGTADDPITATLTGNQTVSPGGACSFHIPVMMNGTGYDQYWTITVTDSTGKEMVVSSGNFHKPHAISASSSPRHLAHLAAQGLSAAQSLGLSSDTIALYSSVLQEFTATGTLANATATQFTSISSYTFLEERDALLNIQGEAMRQAFIQQFLATGDDLSTATQRADYKMRSVLANPALFATIFHVPNFDSTNASFERLLVAGATYANAQTPHMSVLGEDLREWVGRMADKTNVIVDDTNFNILMNALSNQYPGELYASNWTTESTATTSPTPRSIDYRTVTTLHAPEKLSLPPAASVFRTFTLTQDSMVNISLTHDLGIALNDRSVHLSIFNAKMEKPFHSDKSGMSANTISAAFPAGTYYIAVTTDPDTSGGSSYVVPPSAKLNLQIDVEKKSKAMIEGVISLEGSAKAMPVSLSVAEFNTNGKRNTAYGTIEGPKNLNPNLPVWVVVHGRHDSENTSKIEELTKNLKDFLEEGGQVVTVDWQKAANSIALEGADWTKPVGLWVANQLKAVGFTDFSKVNLIGYSWGSYASFYLAEALGEVGSITALDSAADGIIVNSTNSTVINFKNFSKTSWSFEASPIDSNARALTADFAIRIDSGGMDIVHPIRAHGFGITAFSELIRQSIFSKNIDPTTVPFFSPLHLQQNTELGAGSQEVNGIQTLIRKNVYNAISLETGAWSEGFEGILYVTPRKTIDPATGKDWWKADMPQKFVYKQVIGDNDVERTIIFPNLHATIS